jgi:hypothetical protein
MAVGVRFEQLDSSLQPTGGSVEFNKNEVADAGIVPSITVAQQTAQNGKPTFFIKEGNNPYRTVNITIFVLGDSTLGKLRTIRDHILTSNLIRVYPKYAEDTSLFLDGFVNPNLLDESLFSGESKMGETVNLSFTEADKSNQVGVEQDLWIL